jgi:hypothetical protein
MGLVYTKCHKFLYNTKQYNNINDLLRDYSIFCDYFISGNKKIKLTQNILDNHYHFVYSFYTISYNNYQYGINEYIYYKSKFDKIFILFNVRLKLLYIDNNLIINKKLYNIKQIRDFFGII